MQSADNRSAAFGIRHRAGKGLGQSQKCKQSVPTSRRNALFPFVPFFLAFTGRPGSWGWQSPLCSSFTTSREISQSTACLVGGEGPSSPTPRSCSAPIPKGACGRYRLVTIPVVDLDCGLLTSLARDRAETGPCRIGAMATKNVARRRRRHCLRWGRARWRFGTVCFDGFAGR